MWFLYYDFASHVWYQQISEQHRQWPQFLGQRIFLENHPWIFNQTNAAASSHLWLNGKTTATKNTFAVRGEEGKAGDESAQPMSRQKKAGVEKEKASAKEKRGENNTRKGG